MTSNSPAISPADVPVAAKLEALLTLQRLDSQLDEIRRVRGDLPEEVRDLEDEIAGYEVRMKKFDEEVAGANGKGSSPIMPAPTSWCWFSSLMSS